MSSIKPVDFPKGYSSKSKFSKEKDCKKKDQRILTLVLQTMHLLEEEGSGLLASACAPQVVLQKVLGKKQIPEHQISKKIYPLGIYPNSKICWLNACLQLIAFISSLLQWTYFLPKRFDLLKDFIEKYRQNLTKQEAIDSISSQFIEQLKVDRTDPVFSFFSLLKETIPTPLQIPFFLENPIQAMIKDEFFIYLTNLCANHHLFYTFQDEFYELTAFIEVRKDNEEMTYLAYLKIDGKWFQCEDHRIRSFSARNLKIALEGAVFCYYKKAQLTFQKILK